MHDVSDMAVFSRVVTAGSFSAAARGLGLTPALVSRRIQHLEDRLGVRLLNRTTRQLELTEEGEIYQEYCQRILHEIEEAEAAVTARSAQPRGTLKVTASVSFGRQHIAPAIRDFLALYPQVEVRLNLTDNIIDFVKEGMDVAIRIAWLKDSSLIARKLAPNRRVVCGSPEYIARHGEPKTPDDLVHHNCIVLAYPGSVQNQWFADHPIRVSGNLECDNGETIKTWALGGLGLALKSTWDVGDDLRAGRLKAVLTDFATPPIAIYALTPHRRYQPARIRAFVDFLAKRFGPEPYWDRDLPIIGTTRRRAGARTLARPAVKA